MHQAKKHKSLKLRVSCRFAHHEDRLYDVIGADHILEKGHSHFLHRLFAKLHPELREGLTLSIGQSDASLELVAQQTILVTRYALRSSNA
jgi:hypothetical protein